MTYISSKDPYILVVQPDDIFLSPREVEQPLGTMVCFHRRYALGDKHDYSDNDDFLKQMFLNAVGNGESGEEKYDQLVGSLFDKYKDDPFTALCEVENALLHSISEKYVMLPLYLYDHSGLAMSTTDFNDRWDSGQVGWIYVSVEDMVKELGDTLPDDVLRHNAEALLQSEVEIYDAYLRGECYGYELYENGELEDSCWGFIGELRDVCQTIKDSLPDECRDLVDQLEVMEKPQSVIQTLLRHARIQVDQAEKDHKRDQQQTISAEVR